jgi:hypothetical protein
VTLLFCGILVGAYFSDFFLKHILFPWIVFILSYLWIMYRTFLSICGNQQGGARTAAQLFPFIAYWGKIFSRTYFYKKEPILMIGSFFMQNNFA